MITHTIKDRNGNPQTLKLSPYGAIKRHCLECRRWYSDVVAGCPNNYCALWPYRQGKPKRNINPEWSKVKAELPF